MCTMSRDKQWPIGKHLISSIQYPKMYFASEQRPRHLNQSLSREWACLCLSCHASNDVCLSHRLLELVAESKALVRLGIPIPDSAKTVLEQVWQCNRALMCSSFLRVDRTAKSMTTSKHSNDHIKVLTYHAKTLYVMTYCYVVAARLHTF